MVIGINGGISLDLARMDTDFQWLWLDFQSGRAPQGERGIPGEGHHRLRQSWELHQRLSEDPRGHAARGR